MLKTTVTPEEAVCAWMETKPKTGGLSVVSRWWKVRTLMTGTGEGGHVGVYDVVPVFEVCTRAEKWDLLFQAEEKLSQAEMDRYEQTLSAIATKNGSRLVHATPDQKIAALAEAVKDRSGLKLVRIIAKTRKEK